MAFADQCMWSQHCIKGNLDLYECIYNCSMNTVKLLGVLRAPDDNNKRSFITYGIVLPYFEGNDYAVRALGEIRAAAERMNVDADFPRPPSLRHRERVELLDLCACPFDFFRGFYCRWRQ